jgi:hypothetical protein
MKPRLRVYKFKVKLISNIYARIRKYKYVVDANRVTQCGSFSITCYMANPLEYK